MASLWIDILVAFRNLLQHRRRTLFLGTAIAAVTGLLVLLGSLSTGIRETMLHSATTLMTGHLNVGGFYKASAGQSAPVVTGYEKVRDLVHKTLPELAYTVERGRGWAKVVSDTGSMQLGVVGIDIAKEPAFKQVVQLQSGSLDELTKPGTILLFDNQAERMGVKVGDAVTISAPTTRGTNNTVDVRVAAIGVGMGLLSQWNSFVPQETLRALYQLNATSTGAIQIILPDADLDRLPQLAQKLRLALADGGFRVMDPDPRAFWMKFEVVNHEDWTGQKLDVTTWEDELSFVTWILQALGVLTFLLITILLVIVVIGIMNTMWIAIRERTREIGTLRAIGMQRGRVMRLFLMEAIMLGLAGTIGGAAFGAALAAGLNAIGIPVPLKAQIILMSTHVTLAVHLRALVTAVITITVVTALAALYPSLRAARLRPVVAMQHFG